MKTTAKRHRMGEGHCKGHVGAAVIVQGFEERKHEWETLAGDDGCERVELKDTWEFACERRMENASGWDGGIYGGFALEKLK